MGVYERNISSGIKFDMKEVQGLKDVGAMVSAIEAAL